MLQAKLKGILALICGGIFLFAAPGGAQAETAGINAVYNVTRQVYAADLQAAIDSARPGDYLQVINPAAVLNPARCEVDNLTIDLNGARISAAGKADYAITVAAAVYRLSIRSGNLDRGIEVEGGTGNLPLELKLEEMVINGGTAVDFRRNGQLECAGGSLNGADYGVKVAYTVTGFTAVFTGTTFTRSRNGAIYFSGLNNPEAKINLTNCQVGLSNNYLLGPGLKIEGGRAEIEIENTFFAGAGSSYQVHINATGTVNISNSEFYSQGRTAVYVRGATNFSLAQSRLAASSSTVFQYPAVKAVNCDQAIIENNTFTGPGTVALEIDDGSITLRGNILRNFATGISLGDSLAASLDVVAEANLVEVLGTAMLVTNARSGILRGNELTGNTALNILSGQDMQVTGNLLQGRQGQATGLQVKDSRDLTVTDNLFRNAATGMTVDNGSLVNITGCVFNANQTGLFINNSRQITLAGSHWLGNDTGVYIADAEGITITGSRWQDNGTGLGLSGRFTGEINNNTFTVNTVAVDMAAVTAADMIYKENNSYNNSIGFKAPANINNLDITSNYWGSSSGPRHSLYPESHGDIIAGDPVFIPWSPYAFYSDTRPPQVTLTAPATWSTDTPVPVDLAVEEDIWLDRVTLVVYGPGDMHILEETWWGEEWPLAGVSLSWDPAGRDDGSYRFYLLAVDGSGNRSQAEQYLLLDRQPPETNPGGNDPGQDPPPPGPGGGEDNNPAPVPGEGAGGGDPGEGNGGFTPPGPGDDDGISPPGAGNGNDNSNPDQNPPEDPADNADNSNGDSNASSPETPDPGGKGRDGENLRGNALLNPGTGFPFNMLLLLENMLSGVFAEIPQGYQAGKAILILAAAGLVRDRQDLSLLQLLPLPENPLIHQAPRAGVANAPGMTAPSSR